MMLEGFQRSFLLAYSYYGNVPVGLLKLVFAPAMVKKMSMG